MSQRITVNAHIRVFTDVPERRYKIVMFYGTGGYQLTDDNFGAGYQLHVVEELFAMLQKTCVGEYEIPTKVVRCDGSKA